MTRAQAITVLADHTFTTTQQTATMSGEWVNSGTSFDEMLGVRESYNRNEVYEWLGY